MLTKTGEHLLEPGWLKRLRAQPAARSEDELIRIGLRFANFGRLRDWLLIQQPSVQLPAKGPATKAPAPSEQQRWFRLALNDIVEKRVSAERAQEWLTVANGVLPVPTHRFLGRKLRSDLRYQQVEAYSPAHDGMLSRLLVWLMDAERPFGHRLSLCRLESCGKFFLAKPPKKQGKWLRRYCTRDHMKAAHQAATAAYVKRKRADSSARHK